jgi:hypothetical protein
VQVNPERWRQRAAATPAWDTLKGLAQEAHQYDIQSFDDLALLVRRQLVEYFPQALTQRTKDALLAPLRYEHHVILAVPSRVAKTLIFFHS